MITCQELKNMNVTTLHLKSKGKKKETEKQKHLLETNIKLQMLVQI